MPLGHAMLHAAEAVDTKARASNHFILKIPFSGAIRSKLIRKIVISLCEFLLIPDVILQAHADKGHLVL